MIDKLRNIPQIARREIRRTLITTQPVVIQSIDRSTMRCEVAHKDDNQVVADNCPLATTYAASGGGAIPPINPPTDAIAFGSTLPLTRILARRGFIEKLPPRHSMDDLIVMPMVWYDGDDVPDHAPGEWVFAHEDGAALRFKPDGSAVLQTHDTAADENDQSRITLSPPGNASIGAAQSNGQYGERGYTVHEYTGRARTVGATGEGIRTPPDAVDGASQTHGVQIGDPYNARIDPATGEDTAEDADPVLDPTDTTETTNRNPDAAVPNGPIDAGFYEVRHPVFERRAADPDVTVTDETADAYIDVPDEWRAAGRLPPGYPYLNVTTGTLMITDMTGTPVVWQAL